MYFIFGIFLAAGAVCGLVLHFRKKAVVRKICGMSSCEKADRLCELLHPWGFTYLPSMDVLASEKDAWQREFGYHAAFDRSAPHFHMIFDCEPVYFDYLGETWLIEFWKGQYGINTGGEIGVYHAGRLLESKERENAHFQSVSDDQMLPLSMELTEGGRRIFSICDRHWWLTGFDVGKFSRPEELEMKISVTCPDREMAEAFVKGMLEAGYDRCELTLCDRTVSLLFDRPRSQQAASGKRFFERCQRRLAQWSNRLWCSLYCWITGIFCSTQDRMLYLYLMLPFVFRRLVRFRKSKRQRCPGRQSGRGGCL